ncbi:hypothetical protein IV203_035777 [Nitzschia inconspicua]|uniref:Uncharacterized protein n=1 Tax=Nitzschia inconspicua TaxID=303405 RepID=A0A9K3LFN4_9STRA|nr:hypothetical protein IV203_035777 [Nitzschia inconspicua]
MDIAYSKTSMAPPCLCLDTNMCRCTTVTMYMPVAVPPASAKAATSDEEEFPLSCRRVGNEEATEDPSKGGRYQDWNPHILKRIRIHRVASVRELLLDLLGMLGKPLQEQPRFGGAIIIDDLDTIVMRDPNIGRVSGNYGNGHRNATTTAILQTIAVASDTALALESLRIGTSTVGDPISVVATTKDVRMVLSPCIDTIVTLRHISGDIDSAQWKIPSLRNQDKKDSEVGDNITVCSLWQAEIRSSLYSSPELMEEQTSIVDYAIVESETNFGDRELRWKSGGTRLGV